MTSVPSRPGRRRRRFVIASVLLFLMGFVWWNWPRGDARFVGKWSSQTSDAPIPGAIMIYRSNGTSTWTFPPNPRAKPLYTVWEVDGEYLRTGLRSFTYANTTLIAAQNWINSFTSTRLHLRAGQWKIDSVSPDVIELVRDQPWSNPPMRQTLRRIRE
jgi:hypothetical protein